MTENLQNELYQLENNRGKGAKLCVRSELEGDKCSKKIFKVLEKTKPAKIKQYLDYILMVINRHFQIRKKITKDFTPKRQLPKLILLSFLAKFK